MTKVMRVCGPMRMYTGQNPCRACVSTRSFIHPFIHSSIHPFIAYVYHDTTQSHRDHPSHS